MNFIPVFSFILEKNLGKNVAIIGKVIEKREKEKYIDYLVLDAFGYFIIRSFEKVDIQEFSTVLVLGKVKKFKNTLYISPKFIDILNEDSELLWRFLHLNIYLRLNQNLKEISKQEEHYNIIELSEISNKDVRKLIIEIIEKLDKGDGVPIEKIKKLIPAEESVIERIIEELLALGEIYEISPGKLKLLK